MSPLRNVAPEVLHRQGWVILGGVLPRRMVEALLHLQGMAEAEELLGRNMFANPEESRRTSLRKSLVLDMQDPIVREVIEHVMSRLTAVGLLTP